MICSHDKYADRHCANINCSNYFSRCPKHSPSGRRDADCTVPILNLGSHNIDTYDGSRMVVCTDTERNLTEVIGPFLSYESAEAWSNDNTAETCRHSIGDWIAIG